MCEYIVKCFYMENDMENTMEKTVGMVQALRQLQKSDYYPFHMPGHKRNMEQHILQDAYGMDITEIDGFDNLHAPEGMILESMELARTLYGTKKTWFLVNGSTVGILASIYSCVKPGGKILIARNCHKAVYNAISLLNLEVRYLYPQILSQWDMAGSILTEDIKTALEEEKDIQAVVITSPTYDGFVSPIREIADVVHEKNIPLIVDEAHGAHFVFHSAFPESALKQGADLIIQSIHKTLPAFTQTALLHLQGSLVSEEKVARYLSIFQSSSPSYLLMGGIDTCIRLIKDNGDSLWTGILAKTKMFYERMQKLKCIRVFSEKIYEKKDILKLIISVKHTQKDEKTYTGQQLYQELLEGYHLQMEMAADTYVLGILTCMDKEEGLLRLGNALEEIDNTLTYDKEIKRVQEEKKKIEYRPKQAETIASALEQPKRLVDLQKAVGKECGCFLNLYPPGIPLVVPGEFISEELVKLLIQYREQGLNLQGLTEDKIMIIDKTF